MIIRAPTIRSFQKSTLEPPQINVGMTSSQAPINELNIAIDANFPSRTVLSGFSDSFREAICARSKWRRIRSRAHAATSNSTELMPVRGYLPPAVTVHLSSTERERRFGHEIPVDLSSTRSAGVEPAEVSEEIRSITPGLASEQPPTSDRAADPFEMHRVGESPAGEGRDRDPPQRIATGGTIASLRGVS